MVIAEKTGLDYIIEQVEGLREQKESSGAILIYETKKESFVTIHGYKDLREVIMALAVAQASAVEQMKEQMKAQNKE